MKHMIGLMYLLAGCIGRAFPQTQHIPPFYAYGLEEALAAPDSVTGVCLYDLKTFPEEILNMPNLRHLDFIGCTFDAFPKEVTSLTKVERMQLAKIDRVPENISCFPNLASLKIVPNGPMLEIPEEMAEMKQLQYLFLLHAQGISIPKEMKYVKAASFIMDAPSVIYEGIGAFPALEAADIGGVGRLDIASCFLHSPNLRELKFTHCDFLSPNISLAELKALRKLSFEEMELGPIKEQLWEIPHLESLSFIRCKLTETDIQRWKQTDAYQVDSLLIEQPGIRWERPGKE